MNDREWKWVRRFAAGVFWSIVLFIACFQTPTQRALERIAELGGTVNHDSFIDTVYPYIDLSDTHATDADLMHVRQLDPCHCVSLRNTDVTDRGIQAIRGLRIEYLDLRGTSVSKQAIDDLRRTLRHSNPEIESDYRPSHSVR